MIIRIPALLSKRMANEDMHIGQNVNIKACWCDIAVFTVQLLLCYISFLRSMIFNVAYQLYAFDLRSTFYASIYAVRYPLLSLGYKIPV